MNDDIKELRISLSQTHLYQLRRSNMQTSQAKQPMPNVKSTMATEANAVHHTKAAESCNKAAAEHTNAAKACTTGDHAKADEHAKKAECHCSDAQEHGNKAKAA